MRTATFFAVGFSLWLGAVAPVAADDPKDVLDRAIRADAGSETLLARRKVSVSKSHGVLALPGLGDTPTTRECSAILPDRVKWAGEFTPPNNKMPFIITLDGLKGWRMLFGAAQDMAPAEYDAVQDEGYFLWVCTLLPLKERSYSLTALPDAKVNDRPAAGVKIENKARGLVQLFFDRRDNLLVKGIYRSREAGIEVTKESLFSDYRDFDGLKMPTRQLTIINGKKTEDWTYDGYRFPAQLELKVFAKP